jgi:hypothetical protein
MSYDDFWTWLEASKYARYLTTENGWSHGGGKSHPHARRGPADNKLREIWRLEKDINEWKSGQAKGRKAGIKKCEDGIASIVKKITFKGETHWN